MTSNADAAAPGSAGARRLVLHLIAAFGLSSGIGALAGGLAIGLSAGAGVLLSGLNLWALRRITGALAGGPGAAFWALALPFKMIVLVGAGLALVVLAEADPVALAAGFAVLPLTGVFLPRASSVPRTRAPETVRPTPSG